MGVMEKESRKRTRNHNLQKIVLQTIAGVGVLSVALVAPNVIQAFQKLGFIPKPRQREIINISRYRLVKAGLLARNERGYLRLTKKGDAKLRQLELHDYKIKTPTRWDRKWRLLSFDIPEARGNLRDKVRLTLRTIGFERLHNSTWVYPHDCEDLITLLKADFKIGKDLLYIIADKIENDGWLKQQFDLK